MYDLRLRHLQPVLRIRHDPRQIRISLRLPLSLSYDLQTRREQFRRALPDNDPRVPYRHQNLLEHQADVVVKIRRVVPRKFFENEDAGVSGGV